MLKILSFPKTMKILLLSILYLGLAACEAEDLPPEMSALDDGLNIEKQSLDPPHKLKVAPADDDEGGDPEPAGGHKVPEDPNDYNPYPDDYNPYPGDNDDDGDKDDEDWPTWPDPHTPQPPLDPSPTYGKPLEDFEHNDGGGGQN